MGFPSLVSCVDVTALPLYDRGRDAIADRRLVGTWYAEGHDLRIDYDPAFGYVVQPLHLDPTDLKATYDVTRIGDRLYAFLTEYGKTGGGTVLTGAWQLKIASDEFMARGLNTEILRERLLSNPGLLQFEPGRGGAWTLSEIGPQTTCSDAPPATAPASRPSSITLTDDPGKIRQYLIEHQDDPELFAPPIAVRRWLPAGTPP